MNEGGEGVGTGTRSGGSWARPGQRPYTGVAVKTEREQRRSEASGDVIFDVLDLSVLYGDFRAVRDISLPIHEHEITAMIGPSGCGKTTVLRCFNRMNDLIEGARVEGQILYHGVDLYAKEVDAVEVRRRVGMVFQKPNPFPKSIYENVAFGPRVAGFGGSMDDLVEESLRKAALWEEVKDDLRKNAYTLSGGQQQRLCIARTLAMEPGVILMDEPCSALDPVSTSRIEDLCFELKERYTIVIVTHNMQQAARISDMTAFFEAGKLIEFDITENIFTRPEQKRTEEYVTGRFG